MPRSDGDSGSPRERKSHTNHNTTTNCYKKENNTKGKYVYEARTPKTYEVLPKARIKPKTYSATPLCCFLLLSVLQRHFKKGGNKSFMNHKITCLRIQSQGTNIKCMQGCPYTQWNTNRNKRMFCPQTHNQGPDPGSHRPAELAKHVITAAAAAAAAAEEAAKDI